MKHTHDLPLVISRPPPPPDSVLDRLARDLQNGDVALIMTRAKLDRLVEVLTQHWVTQDDFDILQDLKKLKEAWR